MFQVAADNKRVQLLRVRNPWGGSNGEWTGAWGDGTRQWSSVDEVTKGQLEVKDRADGEFWISLNVCIAG